MRKILYVVITILLLGVVSCSEEPIGQTPTNNNPPSAVKNVQVESIPGGARIKYELPKETDISYVKGEYLFQGKTRVVRSSIYNDIMTVDGLGSTDPVEIALYTVNHSEVASQPVKASFTPGTPPVKTIISSIDMQTDFGGVKVTWENETGTEIGITLLTSDDKGELIEGETLYSALKEGDYSFRGYDTKERTFAICITDRWGNVSDTIKSVHSPFYETLLDKSKHKQNVLPLDNNTALGSWPFSNLFNGAIGNNGWHTTEPGDRLPLFFTIDLGTEAKISRFKLWGRQGYEYSHNNIKFFEVWGTTNYKTGQMEDYWETGSSWETDGDWEILGDFYTYKPSGEVGPVTNDDKTYFNNGFEFIIPLEKKNVRYLRFKMKANWSGGKALHISELSFYGDDGSDPNKK